MHDPKLELPNYEPLLYEFVSRLYRENTVYYTPIDLPDDVQLLNLAMLIGLVEEQIPSVAGHEMFAPSDMGMLYCQHHHTQHQAYLEDNQGNLPSGFPTETILIWDDDEVVLPKSDHSKDFRSVRWFGSVYSFTKNQSPVVRMLYEHWEAGTPDVGDETLLLSVDHEAPPARLSNLFREHPAWGTMIVAGGSKGTHRLSPPETQDAQNSS